MSGYVWICLNMPKYVWICLDLLEWLLFYISPFSHLFYNLFSIWTFDYMLECLQETRGYSLKENEAVFLKKQNLIFAFAYNAKHFTIAFLFLRLRVKQNALQFPLYSFFFSTANPDRLTKVTCWVFQIC